MKKPYHQIPFDPAKTPLFYGWHILFWGIIGFLLSAPGQTTGVSAFTEPLINDLGISRDQLSIAYGIGTFASSFLITPAGKLFDRIGARWMGFSSCLALGGVLLLLSQTDHIATAVAKILPPAYALAGLLALLFFLLRFSGQGVLTMVSRNMVMKWFDHHRGLASGISGAAIAFGFSAVPAIFNGIISERGWSATWFLTGLLLILIFAPLLLVFFRDNPEECGLIPDGNIHEGKDEQNKSPSRQFTLPEARHTFAFWAFSLTMALQALVNTAITFHIESIFEYGGMEGSTGFSIFMPTATIAVVITLLGGWLSDRMQLHRLLSIMVAAQCTYLLGFTLLAPGWSVAVVILGGGISGGLFGVLMSVTWPRYYGREHLGAISGQCMTFIVAASAIGPALFSRLLKLTDSYMPSTLICLVSAIILLFGSFRASNPQEQ